MVNQKNQQKELNQTKFDEIKYLKVQVIQNMMVIKEDQHRWFTSFLIKGLVVLTLNQKLANELHKQIIRKFKRRKVQSCFRDNIWGVDLADMESLSKYNKGMKYLFSAIDLFSKYVWVVPLKDKRGITIVNAFPKIILNGRKPNKIWLDQGGEFYNNLFKRFLKINNVEMYSVNNEAKSVAAKRFIKMLKNKIFKHMTAISKNVCFDMLGSIVNKSNNTVHRTIKVKPTDFTSDSYAEYNEDSNEKDPKSKVDDRVRISKYRNIFAKRYTQNWSEEVFIITKIKDTVPLAYVMSALDGESIAGSFYEKELQKIRQAKFRIEKVLKRKGDKLYIKRKGYDN